MLHDALRTLLEALEVVRPAFTRPGFGNLLVVFAGWVLTSGPHAVTQALVTTGVAGRRHHEAFHRFFSRGTWDPDEVGRLLFGWIARQLPEGATVRIVLDDTLATKKGPHVFGIGSHLDAVRCAARHGEDRHRREDDRRARRLDTGARPPKAPPRPVEGAALLVPWAL